MQAISLVAFIMVIALLLVAVVVYLMIWILRMIAGSSGMHNVSALVSLRFLTGPPVKTLLPVSLQNFISMVGVALGVWALVVVISVMGGFEQDLRSKIVMNVPHVQVLSESSFIPLKNVPGLNKKIGKAAGITNVEPLFVGRAMVVSQGNAAMSVEVRGVKPHMHTWSILKSEIVDGAAATLQYPILMVRDRDLNFSVKGSAVKGNVPGPVPVGRHRKVLPAALLGVELAKTMGVGCGDKVQLVVPDATVGPTGLMPKARSMVVGGLIKTGLYQFDLKTMYISLDQAQRSFGVKGLNALGVWGKDAEDSEDLKHSIVASLSGVPEIRVQGVFDVFRGLFSALKLERLAMFMILGLVILVAAFSIFGSLVMIGLERLPAISVLTAMGMRRQELSNVFWGIGLSIGLVGTVAGEALGILTCLALGSFGLPMPAQYYIRELPVRINPWEIITIGLITMGLCVVSSLYPAATALRVDVASGLRNE